MPFITSAEQDCLLKQQAEYEKALQKGRTQQILKNLKVPRMTYNMYMPTEGTIVQNDKKSLTTSGFVWNAPRGRGAAGGNYLIVRFQYDPEAEGDNRCKVTSANDIAATVTQQEALGPGKGSIEGIRTLTIETMDSEPTEGGFSTGGSGKAQPGKTGRN